MSQNWTDDCFASDHQGLTDLQNIENNLLCLKSNFEGADAPSNPAKGQSWVDSAASAFFKLRNMANNAWQAVWDFTNDCVAAGKVKTASLADNALSADATGRGKMADGYITAAKIGTGEVTGAKIDSNAVDASKLAGESITGEKMKGVTAGTQAIIASAATQRAATHTSATKVKEIRIWRKGSVSVYFELSCSAIGQTGAYGRIYRNGAAVGTQRSNTSADWQGWREDVSVSIGDYLQLYTYGANSNEHSYRNFHLSVSNDATIAVVNLD